MIGSGATTPSDEIKQSFFSETPYFFRHVGREFSVASHFVRQAGIGVDACGAWKRLQRLQRGYHSVDTKAAVQGNRPRTDVCDCGSKGFESHARKGPSGFGECDGYDYRQSDFSLFHCLHHTEGGSLGIKGIEAGFYNNDVCSAFDEIEGLDPDSIGKGIEVGGCIAECRCHCQGLS